MAINGGSLEDCFSNVYALTELNGLKWRCFLTPSNSPRGIPVQSDPILKAYGNCLRDGLICTWRRKPLELRPNEPLPLPSFTNEISKELWLFWYSNDPPEKLSINTSHLDADNNGVGTAANGINYEVRVLLFQALHTMIERSMALDGFVRFGRWFTRPLRQPLPGRQHLLPHYIMATNVQFFVHGGNTVCMTVNAQRQPPLLRLSKRHLGCGKRVQVVVGPWSLRAVLLPPDTEIGRNQPSAEKQWEEWKEFVSSLAQDLDDTDDDSREDGVPRMVPVEIDGIRMLYPSCYVCVTMEDDAAACSTDEAVAPSMTPDELITPDNGRRNQLLVSNANGHSYMQGVLQNAYLSPSRPQPAPLPPPQVGPFQAPFPPQMDDDTRWNFIDPSKNDTCSCDNCTHQPSPEYWASLEREPVVDCPLAAPIKVAQKPGLVKTNPLYTAMKRQSKRRSKYSYHRRFPLKSEPTEELSSPCDSVASEQDSSDDESSGIPAWADTNKQSLVTGIYCSADDASYHFGAATPCNSSDDENLVCSPFTPIKVVSPCTNCSWPSAPAEQIPEDVFNQIFQPSSTSRVPPTASQEERQRDYNCYYNPTLREDPYYMSYHSRRFGEKRRSSYPPSIKIPASPEQPGSQETIPATTSPPPELEEHRRRIPEADPTVTMTRTTGEFDSKDKPDVQVRSKRRSKKLKGSIEWPDLDLLDMAYLSTTIGEEMEARVSPCRVTPICDSDSDDELEEQIASLDVDETRAIGEGPSGLGQFLSQYETHLGQGPSFDAMDVDESVGGVTSDNINLLSPPASNERPEAYAAMSMNYGWPRIGGPPSCGDPSMNHIYPTPPSVQSEAQQFSPAPMLPPHQQYAMQHPHQNVTQIQQANAMDTSMFPTAAGHQQIPQPPAPSLQAAEAKSDGKTDKEEPMDDSDDSKDEVIDLIPADSKMGKLWKRVELLPVNGHVRKKMVPSSVRFSPAADVRILCATLTTRRTPLHMPPDYQKLVRLMEKRVPKTVDTLFSTQFSTSVTSTPSQMPPMAVTSFPNSNNYKPTFGPISGGMTPNTAQMQMPPMQPPQSHHIQQFPASQIRTPPMMGGRMGTPVGPGTGPMGPPYAPTPSGPYGQMMAPPNSVQQLNNFVHGPMFNTTNGQIGQHPMGGMGPMGQPMGQPMYPGQMPMMQPCTTAGFGAPPMMGGYVPSGPNMMGPPHPSAPPAYPGAPGPPPAYGAINQMQPMQPPHMRQMPMNPVQQMMPSQSTMPMMNNYTMNSVGPTSNGMQMSNQPPREVVTYAEGSSVVLAIILQDTILDLHFDSVFDACPICSCNTSIRARELGLYLTPPDALRMPSQVQQKQIGSWSGFALAEGNPCTCGFSAVRHRYLSLCSGLFPEDSREATAIEHSVAPVNGLGSEIGLQTSSQMWFDSTSSTDVNMLDLIRIMCQEHYMGFMVNQIAQFVEQADKAIKPQEVGFDVSSNAEYVLSQVDATELMLIGNSAAEMSRISGNRSRNTNQPILQFFHPWGLQVANEVRDPREAEWRGLLSEIGPILERAMRVVRCMQNTTGNIVEGPLTWRALTGKSQHKSHSLSHDDDISLPEPIPYINVAAEKDAIRAAPHVIRHWEHLSLGPIDQPKDVLYLTVVPDSSDVCNMALKYMEQLSQMYERMRLGRHIAWPTGADGRDGCVKVGSRNQNGKYPTETVDISAHKIDFINLVSRYVDNKAFITKLRQFTQQMEESLLQVLSERDDLFDRTAFRETLALDWRAKRAAAAAVALAVEQRLAESTAEPGTTVPPPEPPPPEPPLEPEDIPVDDPGTLPHVIVIYVFNPFTWGTEFRSGLFTRVATLAIMRAFNTVCLRLPLRRRPQLQLEIVPMEQVADLLGYLPDYTNDNAASQYLFENSGGSEREQVDCVAVESLRATVLSVYTQPRVLAADCIKSVQARCMTKFGPGSSLLDSLDEWERNGPNVFYKVPSNAYHLAPPPLLYQKHENGRIIQSSPEEQVLYVTYCVIGSDWLCVTVTDSLGRLNDNCLINLKTRHDHHIYKYRQQTQILDGMSRLWTYILGVLCMETRNWRLVIGRLGRIGHGEFRAWTYLLNKTSLKRHSARLKEVCTSCAQMPGCTGTPSILSACLVSTEPEPYLRMFPGFASTDAYSKKSRSAGADDTTVTHIMVFPTSADIQLGAAEQHAAGDDEWDMDLVDMDIPQDGNDINDEFMHSLFMDSGPPQPSASFRTAGNSFFSENTADVSMENQPLATGYYVSTAPAADVPDWFWSSCPGAKNRTPVHLKSSLHINVPLVHQGDEFLQGKSAIGDKQEKESGHPLDSTKTDEVLRHVLETYNALSWLNIDVVSGERRSCLPIHMQALIRLYHSVARLIM